MNQPAASLRRLPSVLCLLSSVLCLPAFAQTNTFPTSGNVGIGTISPDEKLEVADTTNGGRLIVSDGGGPERRVLLVESNTAAAGYVSLFGYKYGTGAGGLNLALNENGGNVGIGTTSPGFKLDVRGGYIVATYDGTTSRAFMEGASGTSYFGNLDSADVAIGNSSNWRSLVVKNGGNVGIGTNNPSSKLTVAAGYVTASDTVNGPYAFMEGSTAVSYFGSLDGRRAAFGNGESWETLVVDNDKVGIGTTAPNFKLVVNDSGGSGTVANFTSSLDGTSDWGIRFADSKGWIGFKSFAVNGGAANDMGIGAGSGGNLLFGTNGGTEHMRISTGGNVGIGTTSPSHKLAVNGTVRAKEVIVDTGWADYVFADDYRLAPLSEVEAHIREKKHLPGIPSAAEVAQGGVSVGDMQAKLLAKLEEVTLHLIRIEKGNAAQSHRLAVLEQENGELRRQLSKANLHQ